MEINPFLAVAETNTGSSSDSAANRASLLRPINELFAKFKQLNVDAAEFAFLKAIVLFKSGLSIVYSMIRRVLNDCNRVLEEIRGLKEAQTIESLQDHAQMMLAQHINSNNSGSNRFGKLLLVLPMLKNIGASRVESLYFAQTLGCLSVEKLLTDLLKN